MQLPKHYSLAKEHEHHFEIHDARDNKKFLVSKKDVHPATQIKIMKMQKLSGEDADPEDQVVKDTGDQVQSDDPSVMQRFGNAIGSGISAAAPMVGQAFSDATAPIKAIGSGIDDALTGFRKGVGVVDEAPPSSAGAAAPIDPNTAQAQGIIQQEATPNTPAAPAGATAMNAPPAQYDPMDAFNKAMKPDAGTDVIKNAAEESAKNLHQLQVDQQDLRQAYISHHSLLEDRSEGLFQAASKGEIDPNQYMNSKSTGSKIGIALSMLFSGAGQGLSHSTNNMAMDVVNKKIDQDIDAQKANLAQKNNLYQQNREMMGDDTAAYLQTKSDMLSMATAKAQEIAAKSGTPEAILHYNALKMNVAAQQNQMHQQIAQYQIGQKMRQALMQGNVGQTDPASYVPYVVPEPHQKQVFDEVKNSQDINLLRPQVMEAFKKGSSRNPITAAQGQREFDMLMGTTVKEKEDSSRASAFQMIHDKMSPQGLLAKPGDNATRLKTVEGYLNSKASAPTAKAYGIDLSKFKSTSYDPAIRGGDAASPMEGQTASNAQGQRIIMKNGSWVPHGQ